MNEHRPVPSQAPCDFRDQRDDCRRRCRASTIFGDTTPRVVCEDSCFGTHASLSFLERSPLAFDHLVELSVPRHLPQHTLADMAPWRKRSRVEY